MLIEGWCTWLDFMREKDFGIFNFALPGDGRY